MVNGEFKHNFNRQKENFRTVLQILLNFTILLNFFIVPYLNPKNHGMWLK